MKRPGEPASIAASGCVDFERARELMTLGREDEALDWFEVAVGSAEAAQRRDVAASAALHVAALLLGFRRPWEVHEFTDRARGLGGSPALADLLDASACVQLGDATGALQIVDRSPATVALSDEDRWFQTPTGGTTAVRLRALASLGRNDDATSVIRDAAQHDPLSRPLWETVAFLLAEDAVHIDLDELALGVGPDRVIELFAWIAGAPSNGRARIAEALWKRLPGDLAVLAAVALFAWELDTEPCATWSLRLAEVGAGHRVPLLERAETTMVEPFERLRAAIVGAAFDGPRAALAIERIATSIDDAELPAALGECLDGAVLVAGSLIVGAATTTSRALIVATELIRRSHGPEALAATVAGLSLESADQLTPERFDELMPTLERDVLKRVAQASGDHEIATILSSVPSFKG